MKLDWRSTSRGDRALNLVSGSQSCQKSLNLSGASAVYCFVLPVGQMPSTLQQPQSKSTH